MTMKCYFKLAPCILLFSIFFLPTNSFCHASSFSSYDIGGTKYYSGDVTGSAYNIGGTTYYNLNGKNYSSYNIGGTTYYSGNGLRGSSYDIGGTTYSNFGDTRFNSYNIGDTLYYSGDISGSTYNIGGTSYSNIRNSGTSPISTYNSTYFPSYSPTFTKLYNSTLKTEKAPILQETIPTTQTYGGKNGEPTFQTEKAYNMWKEIHDHPAESLSSGFDSSTVENRGGTNFSLPNITSVVNLGGGKVKVSWTSVPDAARYHVFYGPSSKNYIYNTILGLDTYAEIGGLPIGSKYFFTIQAEFRNCPKDKYGGTWCYSEKGKEGSIAVK